MNPRESRWLKAMAEWPKTSAYFFTYFGDVYYGVPTKCPGYSDRVFIVQDDKRSELHGLRDEDRTIESYERLGHVIMDPDVIQDIKTVPTGEYIGSDVELPQLIRSNEVQWKRMFIFGAGASSFCVNKRHFAQFENHAFRPPLGTDILNDRFEPLFDQFPAVQMLYPLYDSYEGDMEACLQGEWQEVIDFYNPEVTARHVNLQFFLQSLFTKISNTVVRELYKGNLYSLMLNKLQKFLVRNPNERIAFTSFNYDTILDQYIEKIFNRSIREMKDYYDYQSRKYFLFKPHGSSNWGWRFNKDRITPSSFGVSPLLYSENYTPFEIYYQMLGDPAEMIVNNMWGMELENNAYRKGRFTINKDRLEIISPDGHYFPGLLLPYRDKDEFVMPYDHQIAMKQFMNEMEELYIIGWKGSEELFNRTLKRKAEKLKQITIVDPHPENVKANLSNEMDLNQFTIKYYSNFEEFVTNLDNILS